MPIDAQAFGPSAATRDARTAIGAARTANTLGSKVGLGVPYADTALGLASLFTDPTPEGAFKFGAGSLNDAARVGASVLGGGVDAAHTAAQSAAQAGMGLGSMGPALAGGAMSLFAGGGPLRFLDSTGMSAKTRRRNADAARVQGDVLRPLAGAKSADDYRTAFRTPVGDSTVGDALLEVADSNLSGQWYADTDHDWLPDPSLLPLQRGLRGLGFTGRGPTRRDVNSMGEVLGGAGQHLIPRAETDAYEQAGAQRWLTNGDEGGYSGDATYAGFQPGPQAGAYGWSPHVRGLARLFGATEGPSVFDDMDTPIQTMGTVDEGGQQGVIGETPNPAFGEYLTALRDVLPDTAARVEDARRRKDENAAAVRDAYANAGG